MPVQNYMRNTKSRERHIGQNINLLKVNTSSAQLKLEAEQVSESKPIRNKS